MKLQAFLNTWEGTQAENKWSRIFIVSLIGIVMMLSMYVFNKETIVTIQPFTLTDSAWVTKSQSSQSYKEAWGWALSQLTGNVTPGNVRFIKERITPLLAPEIYQDTIDTIEVQAKQIKADRVSMRYEPRFVEYESSSDKVFIYGYSFVKGASAKEKRVERTFEFRIEVSNYMPVVSYIDTYKGRPRTAKVLKQLERKEEMRRQKDEA